MKVGKLDYGGALLILYLLLIRALTYEQLFRAFKTNILLTIAGALSLGVALKNSGVVSLIANALVAVGAPLGPVGIIAVVYVGAVFISMFFNNSATVAILGPMLVSVAEKDEAVSIEALTWTLVYSAGSCLMTPLGYQTNLMVMLKN